MFLWTRRFISKGKLKNLSHTPTCQKCKGIVRKFVSGKHLIRTEQNEYRASLEATSFSQNCLLTNSFQVKCECTWEPWHEFWYACRKKFPGATRSNNRVRGTPTLKRKNVFSMSLRTYSPLFLCEFAHFTRVRYSNQRNLVQRVRVQRKTVTSA